MSEKTTPTYQSEASLPIIASAAEIDHFRIISKNGQSQKASIAHVRELTGIDHSLLTEQAVPGEYWIDFDGVRRQVYSCTLQIKYPSGYKKDHEGMIINGVAYGLKQIMSIIELKGCRADNDFMSNDRAFIVNINDVMTVKLRGSGWGRIAWFYGENYATPCTVTLALKYTKS